MKKEKDTKYKGQLTGFPEYVVNRMLECQEEQGNRRDVEVFEKKIDANKEWGGFTWNKTSEGGFFWDAVIHRKTFGEFLKKYPQPDDISKYKGKISGFPSYIVEKMLYYQERQGNKRDVSVFEKDTDSGKASGGFNWNETYEGMNFWYNVITKYDFELYRRKFPYADKMGDGYEKFRQFPIELIILMQSYMVDDKTNPSVIGKTFTRIGQMFTWDKTKEGYNFWAKIDEGQLEEFEKKYPRTTVENVCTTTYVPNRHNFPYTDILPYSIMWYLEKKYGKRGVILKTFRGVVNDEHAILDNIGDFAIYYTVEGDTFSIIYRNDFGMTSLIPEIHTMQLIAGARPLNEEDIKDCGVSYTYYGSRIEGAVDEEIKETEPDFQEDKSEDNKSEEPEYNGDIRNFPYYIVEKMLDYQVKQGNPRDISVFENFKSQGKYHKGMDWDDTYEGYNFWRNIIGMEYFHLYQTRFPFAGKEEGKQFEKYPIELLTLMQSELCRQYGDVVLGNPCKINELLIEKQCNINTMFLWDESKDGRGFWSQVEQEMAQDGYSVEFEKKYPSIPTPDATEGCVVIKERFPYKYADSLPYNAMWYLQIMHPELKQYKGLTDNPTDLLLEKGDFIFQYASNFLFAIKYLTVDGKYEIITLSNREMTLITGLRLLDSDDINECIKAHRKGVEFKIKEKVDFKIEPTTVKVSEKKLTATWKPYVEPPIVSLTGKEFADTWEKALASDDTIVEDESDITLKDAEPDEYIDVSLPEIDSKCPAVTEAYLKEHTHGMVRRIPQPEKVELYIEHYAIKGQRLIEPKK